MTNKFTGKCHVLKSFLTLSCCSTILFFSQPGGSIAASGDILYKNCASGGECSGAGSNTGWVRSVVSNGCYSGECLKLSASFNSNTGLYGAGSTAMTVSGVAGKKEITVVYYQKFSESIKTLAGANTKTIRPYVGSDKYYMATIGGWGSTDFYMSYNKGTLRPESIFNPRDSGETYAGDTRYTVSNGDGTWDVPNGRIAGNFNQGGYNGFGTQWTKVRQWIKLPSTSTATDGESKLWINDQLAFHFYKASMTSGSQATFTKFTFYPSSEAEESFDHWMDDMVVYEGYVPPGGVVTSPAPAPTAPEPTVPAPKGLIVK